MTGTDTIDVDKTTTATVAISSKPDLYRSEASKYVSLSPADWRKSSHYQHPAHKSIYLAYVAALLTEFTRVVRHIPTYQLTELYPHAWLFPAATSVCVGRDGIAIVFDYPNRPERSRATIDTDKVLDELILPHPNNKRYTSSGPNRITQSICSDRNFTLFNGHGHYVQGSALGNPTFVIFEKRYHGFWEDCGIFRGYGEGTSTRNHFKFIEFFGDISETNFTEEKAKARAGLYAALWAARKISGGRTNSISELRTVIGDLMNIMARTDVDEPEVERFLDQFPWILERGLGYQRCHSQVMLNKMHLSRGEQGISPNKFLERNDGYCDILELKRPETRGSWWEGLIGGALLQTLRKRKHRSISMSLLRWNHGFEMSY